MAQGKKSFVAYSDWDGMFQALPDEVAGKLIKHIFAYVNDRNPSSDDYIINALFEQVKSTLKRDLKKWEEQREQRINAGKKSAKIRSTKSNERSTVVNGNERNSTVNVNANVTVNDTVINTDDTHSVFADRLLISEFELDKEAIEVSTKKKVTKQILIEFNANLKNSNKHHSHFSEYKKHLVNWLSKKKEDLTQTKKYQKL